MSTALDKSLDDIISSSRKARKVANNKKKAAGKGVGKAQKKTIVGTKKNGKQTAKKAVASVAAVTAVDFSYATKVVAHGLPKDLRQENIKDFFQSQVGGVQSVQMNYNEKGVFKGVATIVFKSSKNAVRAVEKYNNAPIDGGASKLKLELVIDPSKKPLTARIVANAAPAAAPASKAAKAADNKKKQLQEKKKELQKKRKELQKAKAKAAKADKAPKVEKTAEQLDQEMTDYFNN